MSDVAVTADGLSCLGFICIMVALAVLLGGAWVSTRGRDEE